MKKITLAALACLPLASLANDVSLPADVKATLAPNKVLESCVKLKKGERVAYEFTAAKPLAFNIHYHLGPNPNDPVEYPVKEDAAARKDTFAAPLDQHYCWMWKNKGTDAVTLTGRLAAAK